MLSEEASGLALVRPPMPACPDENTYARLLEGLLPARERALVERHVDGCSGCAEMLAQLGKVYTEEGASPPAAAAPLPVAPTRASALTHGKRTVPLLVSLELVFAFVHVAASFLLARAAALPVAGVPSWFSELAEAKSVVARAIVVYLAC